jgi:hypothetical protein
VGVLEFVGCDKIGTADFVDRPDKILKPMIVSLNALVISDIALLSN